MKPTTAVAVLFFAASHLAAAQKPDPPKKERYVELDEQAQQAFRDGKYADARRSWNYIHNDYPRDNFRQMRDTDPRFVAWQKAYFIAQVRAAMADKLLKQTNPKTAGKAEEAYQSKLDGIRSEMGRNGKFPKSQQDQYIKDAEAPLLDALKKKDKPS